jgi:hypothetical protein
MSLELDLRDWRTMESAPKNCTWVEVLLKNNEIVRAHFAQDLSGEDQPAFSGWFKECPSETWSNSEQCFVPQPCFSEVSPIRWRPL